MVSKSDYRARYYDPIPGRFINEDPLKHMGKSGNFYEYSFNNPTDFSDWSGLQPMSPGEVWQRWQNFGTWLESLGNAQDMTWEFISGTGPQSRDFGPGSAEVKNMMFSPGVNKARDWYSTHGCENGHWVPKKGGHWFGLKGLRDAGMNPTQQFVGSFNWFITPNPDGTVTYTLTNDTSMTSLAYQLGVPSWSRDPFKRGWSLPFGTTEQTYHWKEFPDGKCGCNK
jgi:hypothetical protein